MMTKHDLRTVKYYNNVVTKKTFSQIICAASNMSLMLPIPPPIETPWCSSSEKKKDISLMIGEKIVMYYLHMNTTYRSFLLFLLRG